MTLAIDTQINLISLCAKVHSLGFDLFSNNIQFMREAFGIDNIDKNKLRNIISCEEKRLKHFANTFSHDQHLLNLQSLLVATLKHLLLNLSNDATSIDEFHRQLSRIAVIAIEIDNVLAKAKRKYRFELDAVNTKLRIEEALIKLAADKNKHWKIVEQYNSFYQWLEHEKIPNFLEGSFALIKRQAIKTCHQLFQYNQYTLCHRLDAAVKSRINADAAVKIKVEEKLTTDQTQQNAIDEKTLKKRYPTLSMSIKPRLKPSLW